MTAGSFGSRPWLALVAGAAAVLAAFGGSDRTDRPPTVSSPVVQETPPMPETGTEPAAAPEPVGDVTLAFAGDVHFESHLAALVGSPGWATLGPISSVLEGADLTMVNLESALTERGSPQPKEFVFRTAPGALDLLAAAGVDVVSMANNHAVDYGRVGLTDTLRAVRSSPIPVVGIGATADVAFEPRVVTIVDTDIAFLAASTKREHTSRAWSAGSHSPGIATATDPRPPVLLGAVRAAAQQADVVVVYLHWGSEYQPCPGTRQRTLASSLADAGADVVVGSHAHVLLGSGWLGDTYVNYGLGNFIWYHNAEPVTGILQIAIGDGTVVGAEWLPALIDEGGLPHGLTGEQRTAAINRWQRLRQCTGLATRPATPAADDSNPRGYAASVSVIDPELRERMQYSHVPGCPVDLEDLRYLRVRHFGFDDRVHDGELVVHERYAEPMVEVFRDLFRARWPIRQMRLVDDFLGDDDRSMAANNTSGYNCRRVAGTDSWSAHAYGAAVDVNPVQNPYVTADSIQPAVGSRYARIPRSGDAQLPRGAIGQADVVVDAFARIGWEWGGGWATTKDYQHFAAAGSAQSQILRHEG